MIIVPAILESATTRKDKTLSVRFGTQELSPSQVADIIAMNQNYCFLGIKNVPFTDQEKSIVESLEVDFELNQKTPGQRLRNVLFRLFELDSEGYKTFHDYYNVKMEKIIEHYKQKLP